MNHFGECPTLQGASCARRNIFQSAHFRKCNVTKVCTESCSCSAPPLPHVATDVLKDDILHFSAFCRRKKAFTGNSKTIRACPCWFKEYFLYLKEMFGSQGLLRYMTIFASWSHYWLVVCFTIHGHIHLLFDPKPWLFPLYSKREQHLGLQHFHVSTMSTRHHT